MQRAKENCQNNRVLWIDALRIILTWGVISLHGKSYYDFDIGTYGWFEERIMGYACMCCVPVFLMLSGMLSLRHEPTIHDTVCRRVPKVIMMRILSLSFCLGGGVIVAVITNAPLKEYAIFAMTSWEMGTSYLSVLLGCYLVLPFLYRIVKEPQIGRYFFILAVIFCWIVPSFVDSSFMDLKYVESHTPNIVLTIMSWLDYGQVTVPAGGAMLFVIGHYLDIYCNKITKKVSILFLMIGFVSWELCSIWKVINLENSKWMPALIDGRHYEGYVAPLLTFYSASVLVFVRKMIDNVELPNRLQKVIRHMGKNSVLIYLLHGAVIHIFRPLITPFWIKPFALETIIEATFYFSICYLVSLILEKVPIIRKVM